MTIIRGKIISLTIAGQTFFPDNNWEFLPKHRNTLNLKKFIKKYLRN